MTTVHLAGAFGSLFAWIAGMLLLAPRIRGPNRLSAFVALTALVALVNVMAFGGRPALIQRLAFAVFFLSYLALALVAPRPALRGSA